MCVHMLVEVLIVILTCLKYKVANMNHEIAPTTEVMTLDIFL